MSTSNLIDPSMNWREALTITDAMVRQTLVKRVPDYPDLDSAKKLLDLYTPSQLISAWLIVSRGYSD